jgi:hypothetical protein
MHHHHYKCQAEANNTQSLTAAIATLMMMTLILRGCFITHTDFHPQHKQHTNMP